MFERLSVLTNRGDGLVRRKILGFEIHRSGRGHEDLQGN